MTSLKIKRRGVIHPTFEIHLESGEVTVWRGSVRGNDAHTTVEGHRYAVRRDGRKRFVLEEDGATIVDAERDGGTWTFSAEGVSYELVRASRWKSVMELRRDGATIGSVRGSASGRSARLEGAGDLRVIDRMFVGIAAMIFWSRAAAASSGMAVS